MDSFDLDFLREFSERNPSNSLRPAQSRKPRALVLKAAGSLDNLNSSLFLRLSVRCLGPAKHMGGLIVDMGLLHYASSSGIGSLTDLLVEAEKRDVRLYLAKVSKPVHSVISILGFDRFFNIIPDYEAADEQQD